MVRLWEECLNEGCPYSLVLLVFFCILLYFLAAQFCASHWILLRKMNVIDGSCYWKYCIQSFWFCFSSCIPIIIFREWQSPRILERILPISLKALHYISWRNGLLGRESLFFFFDISMDLPWILILVSWCLELCKKSRHNQLYQLFHSFFSIASVHYLRKPKAR